MLTDEQAESLAQQLEANPNYRVLRKLVPPSAFAEPDGRPLAKGVIVDTETTGLNQDADKIGILIQAGGLGIDDDALG